LFIILLEGLINAGPKLLSLTFLSNFVKADILSLSYTISDDFLNILP